MIVYRLIYNSQWREVYYQNVVGAAGLFIESLYADCNGQRSCQMIVTDPNRSTKRSCCGSKSFRQAVRINGELIYLRGF